jgi:thiamine-phosphate pyrophosphorylase
MRVKRRQTLPSEWLIVDRQPTAELWRCVRRLPRGTGILLLCELAAPARRRLRSLASARDLTVAEEAGGGAARVHNMRELRGAMLRRPPLVLLSPLYPTSSHPDWRPLPRMRAAALARLAKRKVFALGGMNRERYAKVVPLGFIGWAGISAFRT